jgi:hypothetical protein
MKEPPLDLPQYAEALDKVGLLNGPLPQGRIALTPVESTNALIIESPI